MSPTPPRLHQQRSTKCRDSHLGCLFASAKNNGCRSRWKIASVANPYGSEKPSAKSKLHFYRHIWSRISILIASWCVYTQQGLIPERSWLTRVTQSVGGFVFGLKSSVRRNQAKYMNRQRQIENIIMFLLKAICHVAFLLRWEHSSQYSLMAANSSTAGESSQVYCGSTTWEPLCYTPAFLLFNLDVWSLQMEGGAGLRVGVTRFMGFRAEQSQNHCRTNGVFTSSIKEKTSWFFISGNFWLFR